MSKKRILAVIMTLMMVVGMLPVTASAATVLGSYQDGSGFKYWLYDDGTAYVSYSGTATEVEIPSSVTVSGVSETKDGTYTVDRVAAYAFGGNSTVEKIIVPDTFTKIAAGAFSDCTKLKTVEFKGAITEIGESAFSDLPALESFTVPKECTVIGESALTRVPSLKELKVEEGNTAYVVKNNILYTADMKTMVACATMENLVIEDGVEVVSDSLFQGCYGFKNVVLPEGLTELEPGMFSNCYDLESVTIPSTVKVIKNNAIEHAPGITELKLPVGLTTIEQRGVSSLTGLKELVVPKTVTSLDRRALGYNTALESVILPYGLNTNLQQVLAGCTSLKYVTIPPTVTTLNNTFQNVDHTKLTIFGESGSYAETYAASKGATFIEWETPVITTEAIDTAFVGLEFEQKLEGTGVPAPIWYVADGQLPAGVTLSEDGVISGTPEEAGTFTFSVDAYNMGTATKEFTMVVNDPAINIADNDALPEVEEGDEFELTAEVTGMEGATYHIHWTYDSSMFEVEVTDAGTLAVKAVKAGEGTITADLIMGEHGEPCEGTTMATATQNVTVNGVEVPAGPEDNDGQTNEEETVTTPDENGDASQEGTDGDAADKDAVAQTGDNSNMTALFAVAAAALAAAVAVLIRRRERA